MAIRRETELTLYLHRACPVRPRYTGMPEFAATMSTIDPAQIARQLVELRLQHRDLDAAIARLSGDRDSDELQLKRLKKRKLRLKDMIAYLENQLIPDEPA